MFIIISESTVWILMLTNFYVIVALISIHIVMYSTNEVVLQTNIILVFLNSLRWL